MATKRGEGQFLGFAIVVDDRWQISAVDDLAAFALNLSQLFVFADPRTAGAVPAQHQASGRSLVLDLIQLPDQRRVEWVTIVTPSFTSILRVVCRSTTDVLRHS